MKHSQLNLQLCTFLLFCVCIGVIVAYLSEPNDSNSTVSAWWSVIYPEFSGGDLQPLPEGQRDQLEIRWRAQEIWQNLWMRDTSDSITINGAKPLKPTAGYLQIPNCA